MIFGNGSRFTDVQGRFSRAQIIEAFNAAVGMVADHGRKLGLKVEVERLPSNQGQGDTEKSAGQTPLQITFRR